MIKGKKQYNVSGQASAIRVSEEKEVAELDISLHDEKSYNF